MVDEDARLMLAFQNGDAGAFDELFARYTPRLLGFLLRMVRDRARAEELTQDVFIRLYNAADRYEARTRFSTYLFGIAHNLALNDLARAHRKRETPLAPEDRDRWVDPGPRADAQLEAARTQEALERAIGELPERQRAALLLRSQQGLGYEEIAEALGASVASVKSLLHRAREALTAKLGDLAP
jgi:RNA polymerase sigma-70 factor (ECF subfamily)